MSHPPPTDAEWRYFVEYHANGHILQTHAWAQLKSSFGWRASRSSTFDAQGRIVGAASVLTRPLPYGLGRIAYAPRGPVTDWPNAAYAGAALRDAVVAARASGAFALVVEPNLSDHADHAALLTTHGFKPLPFDVQPRRSACIDISVADEKDLLASFKQKTRYNIGLARKRGVTVRRGDARDAQIYFDLMRTTAVRDGFSIHALPYYGAFLKLFAADDVGLGALFIAEHEGQPLSALIATAMGDEAIYLYGASSNEKRELMPTYLIQWEAMRWARERGCKRYDLWGIPDASADELEAQFETRHDGLWGVYRFKRGFGGMLTRTVGAWVRVISQPRWLAYQLAMRRRGSHGLAA
jgi:lipid II:glycine glycyltransferase (peptidoglycan interpeptide bridge formation enzyme)